jgi:hypothetical protein
MDPFPNYRPVVPTIAQHCPFGQCRVCCSHSALVRVEFAGLIRRSWSPAEVDLLSQAARSALL